MKTVKSGTSEPYKILEKEYALFAKKKYAVTCSSGTAGLHLALLALGIEKDDEVIVPDFTMAACGFAVSYVGAKVVTVDCRENLVIDERLIEAKITKKTKAIMAVHIYGRICNMKAINKIAKKHKLKVIEDGCEAQGILASPYADVSVYSLYRNKIVHAEEGGIVCTNKKSIQNNVNYLKNMAFDSKHTYFHKDIGFNYRMANSQAVLALKSLRKVKSNLKKRKQIEKWMGNGEREICWVVAMYAKTKKLRDKVVKTLPYTRYFFKPLSTMPMWKQETGEKAKYASEHGFYIIIDPSMSKKIALGIINEVKAV